MTSLPTRLQISPTNGAQLDERAALENFLGKSRADAARMFFDESNLRFLEDFVFMGFEGFRYYFPTVETYLRDERSKDDPVFVGGLVHVIQSRMDFDGWQLAAAEMRSVLLTIDAQRGKFDLEAETLLALQQLLERLRRARARSSVNMRAAAWLAFGLLLAGACVWGDAATPLVRMLAFTAATFVGMKLVVLATAHAAGVRLAVARLPWFLVWCE